MVVVLGPGQPFLRIGLSDTRMLEMTGGREVSVGVSVGVLLGVSEGVAVSVTRVYVGEGVAVAPGRGVYVREGVAVAPGRGVCVGDGVAVGAPLVGVAVPQWHVSCVHSTLSFGLGVFGR